MLIVLYLSCSKRLTASGCLEHPWLKVCVCVCVCVRVYVYACVHMCVLSTMTFNTELHCDLRIMV